MRAKKLFFTPWLIFLASIPAFSQPASGRQEQLKSHLRLAQQYLAERRPDLAIPELKAVVALDPENADARGNLGVLLFFRGDYADATPQLQAALKLRPDLWKIQALLGMSEERIGNDSNGRKDLETAFPHLQEAKIKLQVGNALIDSYTSTGDLDKAAATVSVLLKLEPTNVDLLYTSYRLYSDLADQSTLTMAMIAPNSAQMHQMMARAEVREGDSTAAIANYRDAIKINPKDPGLHFELAELLNASGTVADKQAAVAEYQAALVLNPQDEKSECQLGKMAEQNGDSKTAFADYSRAIKLQPDDAVALTGLADALIAMQQTEKALPLLERAVQLDPTSPAAHFRLSSLYRRAGRAADAKRELDAYLKYKKMKAQLAAIFKQMRLPQAKDAMGDFDDAR